MSNYYFCQLSRQEQRVYQKAYEGILGGKSSVQVGRVSMDRFSQIVGWISYDHPELYFVDFHKIEMTETLGAGTVWKINYMYPASRIRVEVQYMNDKVDRIIASAGTIAQDTPLMKCRWIHDTLVKNVVYDDQAFAYPDAYPEAYTVQGVFEKRRAVCQGIALAVTLLGDRLGLELPVVSGKKNTGGIGDDRGHAWNLVRINGTWAHMDVTWDINQSSYFRTIRYDYFCISDEACRRDHVFYNTPQCPSDTGLSFFEQTGRAFTELSQCEQYISEILAKKKTVIYFKYQPSGYTAKGNEAKLEKFILRKAAFAFMGGVKLDISLNQKQEIFFYRITVG